MLIIILSQVITNFYPSLRPKSPPNSYCSSPYGSTPPVNRMKFKEVPTSEPDLTKQPKRSAMKGAKERERQQMMLVQMNEKLESLGKKARNEGRNGKMQNGDWLVFRFVKL